MDEHNHYETPSIDQQEPLLRFFYGAHLPEAERTIAAPFGLLARSIVRDRLVTYDQRQIVLRHLIDAKDAALGKGV